MLIIIWLAPRAGKMNQIARCDWLPERARWSFLARLGLPAVFRKQNFSKGHIINPLLTKFFRSRWLDIGQIKFFFCVFMDRDEVEVHKLQFPAILTKQTWSIKNLLYGFKGNFACGIQRVVPSGQDGSILSARLANHIARFGSSCPLAEVAI